MGAGPGKTSAVSLRSGVGRVRAGTIAIGNHVIAIDSIGTMTIVSGQRPWWLFALGALIIVGAATQLYAYGAIAIAGIGLGVALILGGLSQRADPGLAIGASDGCATLLVSRDPIFLQRLLQFLSDRIDTGDQTLAADFDIARGALSIANAGGGSRDLLDDRFTPAPIAARTQAVDSKPAPDFLRGADDALFGDTFASRTNMLGKPVQAERRQPFDRLLDGSPKSASRDDDWLAQRDPAPQADSDGGASRVVLALLIVAMLGAGVFATWYFTGETGPTTSLTTIDIPVEAQSEAAVTTPEPMAQTAETVQLPIAAVVETPPPAEVTPPPVAAPPEPARIEIEAFTPPAPMVTRSSGQAYRAAPSVNGDVVVLAESRAGGEALTITGRLTQADGDWYRVELADGRAAWFKASLAVPRARFAETVGLVSPRPDASFAASAPQILEPAEGAQLGGGPQPVRLAWSHREDSAFYILEIESFDAQTQRWIDAPRYKRASIEGDTELAEMFPAAGHWRWRVRGVTVDGQQSQFSRWSAFAIRN